MELHTHKKGASAYMERKRFRDLGFTLGEHPPGPLNALTDVPGVAVGHTTLICDQPRVARTGVTVILPRGGAEGKENVFAGYHSFNGAGEMTGLAWLEDFGTLTAPIGLTNTLQVGLVRDAILEWMRAKGQLASWATPVAAETYDGRLSDIHAFHLSREDVFKALDAARGGPVREGCVGGGTGMNCHGFKAGIGTASRVVRPLCGTFTVGALVQANYGMRHHFRVNGVPVGLEITAAQVPLPSAGDLSGEESSVGRPGGSIIVVIGTDAPLIPPQVRRLAQRATVGLARMGGIGHDGSGDLFLAFATGNTLSGGNELPRQVAMFPPNQINALFEAAAEATEEAILNALCMATDMVGRGGAKSFALPLEELQRVMLRYRPEARGRFEDVRQGL